MSPPLIELRDVYKVYGEGEATVAALAGVNNAAINYYFRSKDQLIERCMQVTLENAFDFADFERLPGGSARERCAAILNELVDGGLHYPGIARAHFFGVLAEGRYDSLAVEKLNQFAGRLAADLAQRGFDLPPAELRLALVQAIQTVLMAVLAPGLFQSGLGIDLNDADTRAHFIERLVEKLFC